MLHISCMKKASDSSYLDTKYGTFVSDSAVCDLVIAELLHNKIM